MEVKTTSRNHSAHSTSPSQACSELVELERGGERSAPRTLSPHSALNPGEGLTHSAHSTPPSQACSELVELERGGERSAPRTRSPHSALNIGEGLIHSAYETYRTLSPHSALNLGEGLAPETPRTLSPHSALNPGEGLAPETPRTRSPHSALNIGEGLAPGTPRTLSPHSALNPRGGLTHSAHETYRTLSPHSALSSPHALTSERFVLEVMYDGTCFHGSQVQNELPTVQLSINNALSTLLRQSIASLGASRTDEGVHALSNFYQFDHTDELRPDFMYKLNAILPHGIAVKAIYKAGAGFNARFDATSRSYRYRIYNAKNPFKLNRAFFYPFRIDHGLLNDCATALQEYRLFDSFCKRHGQSKTTECTILESRWEHIGDELHYIVRANRFLRGMVRGLVGTQLHIARGGRDVAGFRAIVEVRDCTKAFFNVPGHGLYLEEVEYPAGRLSLYQSK